MKIPTAMDDNSVSHHNGGQLGSQTGVDINSKENEEPSPSLQYSIPGILHFIQHEWSRFELERSQWEVDRAELEARIAFLQGERKGQENLKNDLVRRIKMLEYALKQERAKFHKLKYGVELQQGDMRPPAEDTTPDVEPLDQVPGKQGRQLIRQYLQEIGCADTILEVRSNRLKTLLGLNNNDDQESINNADMSVAINGNKQQILPKEDFRESQHGRGGGGWNNDSLSVQETAAVFANFEFLAHQEMDMDDLDDLDAKQPSNLPLKQAPDEVENEPEEMMNERNMMADGDMETGQGDDYGLGVRCGAGAGGRETDEEPLALGELAQLTVSNEEAYDVSAATKESFRKTWNAKYTLRSHFDGVRALAFHPIEPVLVTASEDHTLKLWNLQRTMPAKKSASLDVEPLYTFRAHSGPVLCLAMGAPGSQQCWSGGLDGNICCWNLPLPSADPYDAYEPYVLGPILSDHGDAVWSLAHNNGRLLSAGADGTVRLWNPQSASPLAATLRSEADGAPSCVDFAESGARAVACYDSAHTVTFDLETGASVLRVGGDSPASRVCSHPTLPLTITAHEDHHIRFWDNTSGRLAHSMVAHLDAVTSLAVDPNGLFLLSGSHDCSIRLWNLDNKTCVQEITAHRKKFDESILDVAFHPVRPYIASAGADGLAKVFV